MKTFDGPLADSEPLVLEGDGLTIDDVIAVARRRRRVAMSPTAIARVRRCRAFVDRLIDDGTKIYGLTTGFGKLRDVAIPRDMIVKLQENLIRSHAAGVGDPLDEDVVRAVMLLRAATLCRGHSGVRIEVVQALLDLLNSDVYPHVPALGSVGASGDLAPLSHLALAVVADPSGRIHERSLHGTPAGSPTLVRARDAEFVSIGGLSTLPTGVRPLRLEAKEGLALNNGTQVMSAIASLALHDAEHVLRAAELVAAMSLEASRGVVDALDERLHAVRALAHQGACARRLQHYVAESEILGLWINSGHLGQACRRLDEAVAILKRPGLEPVMPAEWLASLESAVAGLQAALPTVDGRVSDDYVARFRGVPVRRHLDLVACDLAPARRAVVAVLREVELRDDRVGFGELEAALVAASQQLRDAVPAAPLVQDDYSLRCFPQVAAGAWRALHHVREIVAVEINAATDNPLIFPSDDATTPEARAAAVLGGGNFHGQPIATAMDYLAIAFAEIGSIAERRIAHLVDENQSRGLPAFLTAHGGLDSGLMVPQYTAAALVSENKVLCHPASVDSIPTCANSEDHVSMGTIAARKCATVLDHVRKVIAIELLTAHQGLYFRAPLRPGLTTRAVREFLESRGLGYIEHDVCLAPVIAACESLLLTPQLARLFAADSED